MRGLSEGAASRFIIVLVGCALFGGACHSSNATGSGGAAAQVTCGPGTRKEGTECVAAVGGGQAPIIVAFEADKEWGDAPLATTLGWTLVSPTGATLSCDIDVLGDGTEVKTLADCPLTGTLAATYTKPGPYDARLLVYDAMGNASSATERIDSNHIDFVPGLVQVQQLPGLVSSTPSAGSVTLVFDSAAHVPSVAPGAVVWDAGPPGYVRKAKVATKAGTKLTLTTDPAGLEDIATGGFYGVQNVSPVSPTMGKGKKAKTVIPIQGCDPAAWPVDSGATVVSLGTQTLALSPSENVVFDDLRIATQLNASAEFWWGASLSLDLTTAVVACSTVSANIMGSWPAVDLELPSVLGTNVQVGPLSAALGVLPKFTATVTGSVGAQADFVGSASSSMHIAYGSSGVNGSFDAGQSYSLTNTMVTASGDLNLTFGPGVELKWGDPPETCDDAMPDGSLLFGVYASAVADMAIMAQAGASGASLCLNVKAYAQGSAIAKSPYNVFACADYTSPMLAPISVVTNDCFNVGAGGAGGAGSTTATSGTGGSGGAGGASTTSGGGMAATTSTGAGGAGGSSTSTGAGGGLSILAFGQHTQGGIVVEGGDLYWANGNGIEQCTVADCAASLQTFAPTSSGPLAVDATNVYWYSPFSIYECPFGGCMGMPTVLESAGGIFTTSVPGIAAYAGNMYWLQNGAESPETDVTTCDIANCASSETILASTQASYGGLAVDNTNVYWTSGSAVYECFIGGCGNNPTTLGSGMQNAQWVTVSAGDVYWTDSGSNGSDGAVYKCASSGCASPTRLVQGLSYPTNIAVDATNVYWIGAKGATIQACSINGCANPTTLASGQGAMGIALDASSVYWANGSSVVKSQK